MKAKSSQGNTNGGAHRSPHGPSNGRGAKELAAALHPYEAALRNSSVTVFTQDLDLRYRSISNKFIGREVDEIVGRTDADIIPLEDQAALIAVKRRALESGEPQDAELPIHSGDNLCWFDFHFEPLREAGGRITGLACAAVDVTDRKAAEAHLRLVLRELTHRSKNLLAVIQAMARQTARRAASVEEFLEHFSARIQGLARSHDLLVQESWHGVSLEALIHSHIDPYVQNSEQVSITGPPSRLKPETAQSVGIALHELVANAVTFGALSVPGGSVAVSWRETSGEPAIELTWSERGGPTVEAPKRQGFGSLLIQRNLARSLETPVDLDFGPDGVHCVIRIGKAHLIR